MQARVENALWVIVARARDLMESELLLEEVVPNREMAELEEALTALDRARGLTP
jgi:hypothetical protein